jgi:23S rRNA U2552 (ribose-2'-O)-methylase RlmE/FtsJ
MTSQGFLLNDFLFDIQNQQICVKYESVDNGTNETNNYRVSHSLRSYLHAIKNEIDNVAQKWDKYKKITNKYEYINTSVPINGRNITICSYKPISRSYFKLIEIFKVYDFKFPKHMKSFHLAEGPGGFIEAIANYRKNNDDIYYGFTLLNRDKDVPKWNKIYDFLQRHRNIRLEYGPKRDGNLYHLHNLEYFNLTYADQFDFVTADGGFDYSTDFNKQEESSLNLIFCEILYALIIQKSGGSFVLKVFDIFHNASIQCLYLLSFFYQQVFIYKPSTSREANSEKYVICKGFRDVSARWSIIHKLCMNFEDIIQNKQICNIFNFEMNLHFINKIQEMNSIYSQIQIENILHTLSLIRDESNSSNFKDKINNIKMSHIKKCIDWCKVHNQPIQPFLQDFKV